MLRRRSFDWLTILRICAAIACVTGMNSTADEGVLSFKEEVRHWRDSSGAFGIDASMVSYQDRRVTLRDINGNTMVVPVERLCEADQKYLVAKIRAARPSVRRSLVQAQNADTPPPVAGASRPVDDNHRGPRAAGFHRLFGIDWYRPNDAFQLASSQRKPVMWFRVLGDLTGFM